VWIATDRSRARRCVEACVYGTLDFVGYPRFPAEPLFRSWFLENEKTVTQFCRKLAAERPLKDIRDEYNYPKKKGIKDECSRLLEAATMKSRRGFASQRLMNAMRQAHADGWFIVFD